EWKHIWAVCVARVKNYPRKKHEARCGVYGERSVFSDEIEHNADVEALEEASFYRKRYK
ncbi:hypothetical protein L916_03757, partial [Phytophthora nicotianae]